MKYQQLIIVNCKLLELIVYLKSLRLQHLVQRAVQFSVQAEYICHLILPHAFSKDRMLITDT